MTALAKKTVRKAPAHTMRRAVHGKAPVKKAAVKKAAAKKASVHKRDRIGSGLDDLLRETGDYEAVKAVAIKRVIAWQIGEAMREEGLTKTAMAERMGTSRSQLDRLLDPANEDVSLATLARAAAALGRDIRLELA